jgi:aryl-alcohol dehydrogenase-like predicted oxidoreductase
LTTQTSVAAPNAATQGSAGTRTGCPASATSLAQLADLAAAAHLVLDTAAIARLDAASAEVPAAA